MTKEELEAQGYEFNITPLSWSVTLEVDSVLDDGILGDQVLSGNEEAMFTSKVKVGGVTAIGWHKNMERALDCANADFVKRRING